MEAMTKAMPEISELGRANDVAVLRFGDGIKLANWEQGRPLLPKTPEDNQTDIGEALEDVQRRFMGQRLAAVILMSDGAQRTRQPKADLQRAARDLARFDCPIYAVGFGMSREQSQTRDVAVDNLPDQYSVFAKNELEVQGQIRSQGYVNQRLNVWLDIQSEAGDVTTLGPTTVLPTSNS